MRRSGVALLATAIVATACGAPTPSGAADAGRAIDLDLSEFRYAPMTISVKAGEVVTLRLKNSGNVVHEFMAGRDPIAGVGYKEDWLGMAGASQSGGHDMDHRGAGIRVEPKGTAMLTITVPAGAGEFEFGCFVAGHYEGGMKGKLIVAPSVAANTRAPLPAATAAPARPAATPSVTPMPSHSMGDMEDEAH